ncbi:hypothetical protein 13VO501A_gene0096 [Vibrio phage 13VO501A]|nr:hypothetical protein 13VO501A_gene0096 [Vibrio phage 13VO501A]
MGFNFTKKAPSTPNTDPRLHVKEIQRASVDDIPNYKFDSFGFPVHLYLAANDDITRTYSVYAQGWFVGYLVTGGATATACKVSIPSNYGDLGGKPKFTPTAPNMFDGIAKLIKAANINADTLTSELHKAKVKIVTD